MLKYRLLFGFIMITVVVGVIVIGAKLDGTIDDSTNPVIPVKGSLFCVIVSLLMVLSHLELKKLASCNNIKIFLPVSIPFSILLAISWYLFQFSDNLSPNLLITIPVAAIIALLMYQAVYFGNKGVLANCGATFFVIFYTGFLSSFFVKTRVEMSLWPVLMLIFTIKCSDIGAYTVGKLIGKHKLIPKISPAKTWEGMAGAIIFASVTAVIFSIYFNIMPVIAAIIFGAIMAIVGQAGDLAESMLKRDAQQKDSSATVPGFGGILDIVDSLLIAAPIGYFYIAYLGN